MLPDMNEKKGKLSLQISSKGTSYAGSQVLPFWQGVSVGKEFKKKLGTAFLFEFCVPSCLRKSRWIVKSPFPASPICATLTCSGSERFKPSEFIRHKFLCQFFAKRGTTCDINTLKPSHCLNSIQRQVFCTKIWITFKSRSKIRTTIWEHH